MIAIFAGEILFMVIESLIGFLGLLRRIFIKNKENKQKYIKNKD